MPLDLRQHRRSRSAVQYPRFGGANQQCYYTGGTANLGGKAGKLRSRSNGLIVDVAGESASPGALVASELRTFLTRA